MRRFGISVAALFSTLLTVGATAHAEVESGSDNVPAVSGQAMGKVAVRRGVQGPGGLFTARLLLLVNASKDNFGKPTSLAPDLFYSVSDTVQIGLLHTLPMGWHGLLFGDFHLSLHSSLVLLFVPEPTGVMWTIGLAGKFHFSNAVALFFDPQVGVILSHRDRYNDQLFIPVELQFQATAAVSVKVLSGVSGRLSELGDTVEVPLGLGLVGNVSSNIDLGMRFSFDNLLGHVAAGVSRADVRSIGLLLTLRS